MTASRARLFVFLICAVGAICGTVFVARRRATPTGPLVRIVVPDGWCGMFKLALDVGNGTQPDHVDEEYIYTVPMSGVLAVRDFKPLEQWHFTVVEYSNGTRIPDRVDPESGTGARKFDALASTSDGAMWYLIGTVADRQAAFEAHFRSQEWRVGSATDDCGALTDSAVNGPGIKDGSSRSGVGSEGLRAKIEDELRRLGMPDTPTWNG